jgi:hypothetical protein
VAAVRTSEVRAELCHSLYDAEDLYVNISSRNVKRPGREAAHSLPSSSEVKNEGSYISAP